MAANFGAVIAQQGAFERAIPHLKPVVELEPANEIFQHSPESRTHDEEWVDIRLTTDQTESNNPGASVL